MAYDSLTLVNSFVEYYALQLTNWIFRNYWVIINLQFCNCNFKPTGSSLRTSGFCLVTHGCKLLTVAFCKPVLLNQCEVNEGVKEN